jgi:hypothetical protein
MEPEPSPVSSNDDRDLLVRLGDVQEFLPAIHRIKGVAVHLLEQVSFGQPELVPKTPPDELPNAKTQHRFTARRDLRNEPRLLQELRSTA